MKILLYFVALPALIAGLTNDRYYPRYHLAPQYGWMNDPNGLCQYQGYYHLFYQFNPNSSLEPGTAHWAHAKSKDLFNWIHLPIAMYPDQEYDRDGVFSGSALIEDDIMYLFYTTNIKHDNETPSLEEHQALATSTDGVTVNKDPDNPIINGEDQGNFRDPKVWKHNDTYYMVLGNSFDNDELGRVLLYSATDLYDWQFENVVDQSDGDLGYMWECPDLFELDGKFVLLFSPQGVEPQGDRYKNLYQTGYFIGNFDYDTLEFTRLTEFVELDFGYDFYATQTFKDDIGRRILIAWIDMWERDYPEEYDGFTGQMSIPRELSLSDDLKLIQIPVDEIKEVRGERVVKDSQGAGPDDSFELEDNAAEIEIVAARNKDFQLFIDSSNTTFSISYAYSKGTVTLDRGDEYGTRRTSWKPKNELKWLLYIDSSSIELFCGKGEVTFSSRFFPSGTVNIRLSEKSKAKVFSITKMNRTVPKP